MANQGKVVSLEQERRQKREKLHLALLRIVIEQANRLPVGEPLVYSLGEEDRQNIRAIKGQRLESVREAVDSACAQWKNAPEVQIVEHIPDLPFETPPDAEGLWHNGRVWLVAENLPTRERAI